MFVSSAGERTLTADIFPFDLDTTSIALTIVERHKEVIDSVMDEMLQYVDSDGIVQVIACPPLSLIITDPSQTYFDLVCS